METRQEAELRPVSRDACISFAVEHLSGGTTRWGISQWTLAIKSADLAEKLYLSRYSLHKEMLPPKKQRESETIWAAALLSAVVHFKGVTFEDVEELTNREVASYMYIVNPDMRLPIFERQRKYLTSLSCGTNLAKLIVLSRVLVIISHLNDDARSYCKHGTDLWCIANALKQLQKLKEWSIETHELCTDCACNVIAWIKQGLLPWKLPRSYTDYGLDFSATTNNNKLLFE